MHASKMIRTKKIDGSMKYHITLLDYFNCNLTISCNLRNYPQLFTFTVMLALMWLFEMEWEVRYSKNWCLLRGRTLFISSLIYVKDTFKMVAITTFVVGYN